jgi:hypothetical protein
MLILICQQSVRRRPAYKVREVKRENTPFNKVTTETCEEQLCVTPPAEDANTMEYIIRHLSDGILRT